VAKLLTTLFEDEDPKRDKPKAIAWIVTLITTGLRRSELASLRWDKVDFEHLEAEVVGKGNKERVVPILPRTAQVLREYRETLPDGETMVFPTKSKTGVWDTQASNLMIGRLCDKASIKRYSAHQFRHFFTTYALKRGAKLEVISRILGHANVRITADVYRHVNRDEMHEEHQRFAPLSQPLLEERKEP
jgi:integrase